MEEQEIDEDFENKHLFIFILHILQPPNRTPLPLSIFRYRSLYCVNVGIEISVWYMNAFAITYIDTHFNILSMFEVQM